MFNYQIKDMDSEIVIPESNDNENSNSEQAGENKQANSR